jgi:hypothetical protein
MLVALNDAGADYLVVGAFAMAAHGCPRATGDIDLWVRPSPENARCVWRALGVFGAPLSQVTLEDFSTPDVVFQIGIAPQRIDLLTSISGVEFDDAWPKRIAVDLDGLHVNVIGRDSLIQNKIASGRPKDLLDVELLREG